jgi:hypothetical protein
MRDVTIENLLDEVHRVSDIVDSFDIGVDTRPHIVDSVDNPKDELNGIHHYESHPLCLVFSLSLSLSLLQQNALNGQPLVQSKCVTPSPQSIEEQLQQYESMI